MRLLFAYVGTVDGVDHYAPMDKADEDFCKGKRVIVCDAKGDKALRTELQSRSLHLYFTLLAEAFNDAGLSVTVVLRKLFKSPNFAWSSYLVKERIWREVQDQTIGKRSTTKLETGEVSMIHDSINRATSDKLGVSVPFPDKYNLMDRQLGRN